MSVVDEIRTRSYIARDQFRQERREVREIERETLNTLGQAVFGVTRFDEESEPGKVLTMRERQERRERYLAAGQDKRDFAREIIEDNSRNRQKKRRLCRQELYGYSRRPK